MRNGFIYILTNELMDDVVKIGQTKRDVQKRCAEISNSTGVATPYKVVYSKEVQDCVALEKEIHRYFKNSRVNKQREFFYLSVDEVIEYIEELTFENPKEEFVEKIEFEEIKPKILSIVQMPINNIIRLLETKLETKVSSLKMYSCGSITYRKTLKEIKIMKKDILVYRDALEKQYQKYLDCGEIKDVSIKNNNVVTKTKPTPLTTRQIIDKLKKSNKADEESLNNNKLEKSNQTAESSLTASLINLHNQREISRIDVAINYVKKKILINKNDTDAHSSLDRLLKKKALLTR